MTMPSRCAFLRASKSSLAETGSLYPAMYRSSGASLMVPPWCDGALSLCVVWPRFSTHSAARGIAESGSAERRGRHLRLDRAALACGRLSMVALPGGERVRLRQRRERQLTEPPVEIVVQGSATKRAARRACARRHPFRLERRGPDGDGREQRRADARPVGTLAHVLHESGHIGDDLRPEQLRRAAAAAAQTRDRGPCLAHHLEVLAHGEGGRFEKRAEYVAAPVRGGQAEERAAQVGVEPRRALPGEVRQGEEAAGAGTGALGLVEELVVRRTRRPARAATPSGRRSSPRRRRRCATPARTRRCATGAGRRVRGCRPR